MLYLAAAAYRRLTRTCSQVNAQIGSRNMAKTEHGNARASVLTPIAAGILRSVEPTKTAKVLKKLERYELEISTNQTRVYLINVLPTKQALTRN